MRNKRPRRLREKTFIRNLVQETTVHKNDLIQPLFIVHGKEIKKEIDGMPGQYHLSVDQLSGEIKEIKEAGIKAVLLFGLPQYKDAFGSEAYDPRGIVQQGIREVREHFPEMLIMTDVCLCQYTDHGHCGIVENGKVLNDESLELIAQTALTHAQAGADTVAPSDMMDGRVAAIRQKLDLNDFQDVSIMSYSVKYASVFYGPFRQAAGSSPQFGDRRSYQMDPANVQEALREAQLDVEEGADMLMVKPALAYLDVIKTVKDHFPLPLGAYQVSGEYSMIKNAVKGGLLNNDQIMVETLTSIKRAGADMIITYFAKEMARWIDNHR
ncbi:porphobilinogen synthase [Tindallia californiensis]|uniref:Delta-aminolevulinic acid dehydratase n=1 Tax=Tindallia californiensis TaxID=159292 RepID=A0A1H3MMT1_9FIRM|nr:porphobilinogen synthase [Tindallia californiensis]SDY77764.1 porphobilinogen synthase [Tindallia californiensis]